MCVSSKPLQLTIQQHAKEQALCIPREALDHGAPPSSNIERGALRGCEVDSVMRTLWRERGPVFVKDSTMMRESRTLKTDVLATAERIRGAVLFGSGAIMKADQAVKRQRKDCVFQM